MSGVTRRDLEGALGLVSRVGSPDGTDPFPLGLLADLRDLLDVATAAYCETSAEKGGFGEYERVTRPQPPWLNEALATWGKQDPTHSAFCYAADRPVSISDFLTSSAFKKLDLYNNISRPLDEADCLRLYLPAPDGRARFFFFASPTWGFSPRQRELLDLLRPHLILWRSRWGGGDPGLIARLTPRQREVLSWIERGETNAMIARRLWISEHTVRRHIENIFTRLGVATRTEAVARANAKPKQLP
jgi:DNA-binding CsgD family transcriptional regulator